MTNSTVQKPCNQLKAPVIAHSDTEGYRLAKTRLAETSLLIQWDETEAIKLHGSMTNDLRHHTGDPYSSRRLDPVLAVSIAYTEQRAVDDAVWRAALDLLVANEPLYLRVLNCWMYPPLLDSARQLRASLQFDAGVNLTLDEDWPELLFRVASTTQSSRFPTGISSLDNALGGGLFGLTFVGGSKGVGKTALLLNAAYSSLLANPKACVLYYTLDIQRTRLARRLMSLASGVPSVNLPELSRNGELPPLLEKAFGPQLRKRIRLVERRFERYGDGFQQISSEERLTLLLQERAWGQIEGFMTFDAMQQDILSLRDACQGSHVLVVIDPLQKIPYPPGVSGNEIDKARLDMIDQLQHWGTRQLGEGNLAFLVASEYRKSTGAHSKDGNMDDLKGDGRIAADADVVLEIGAEKNINVDTNLTQIKIIKGREGVSRGSYKVHHHHRVEKFEPLDAASEAAPIPGNPVPAAELAAIDAFEE